MKIASYIPSSPPRPGGEVNAMTSHPLKSENSTNKQGAACAHCEGPFELWGVSTNFRLLRCKACGTVSFVDWTDPLPIQRETPQETYASPVDTHFPA